MVLALLLSLAAFHAPSFLLISERPVRSDAVVFFVGGETGTREKEAHQLLREGFADYLLVPGQGLIKKRGPDGRLERLDPPSSLNTSHLKLKTAAWLENTHIEVLEAKRLMDDLGLRSALFISSPYHMRRIKLITGHVFKPAPSSPPLSSQSPPLQKEGKGGFIVYAVPTRYETQGKGFWLFNSSERKSVLTEYAKITWFLAYSPFVY